MTQAHKNNQEPPAHRLQTFIINLKDVPYMDDTGLEVISKTIHLVQENKIDIYFVGANDIIFSQFEKEKMLFDQKI